MSWFVGASLNVLLDEINRSAPNRNKASDGSIGDQSHQSKDSDHNPCDCHDAVCARDFTHDPAGGFDSYVFADWLRLQCQSGAEQRVSYIVSNRRITSGTYADDYWTWRPYSGSNPHDHHVHVSVNHGPERFNDEAPWGWDTDTDENGDDELNQDQANELHAAYQFSDWSWQKIQEIDVMIDQYVWPYVHTIEARVAAIQNAMINAGIPVPMDAETAPSLAKPIVE